MIFERLKVACYGRGSQHPTCRGSSCCRQGERAAQAGERGARAAQAALRAAHTVSAMALGLQGSRAGLNVVKQKLGGYFSNRDKRWSCKRDR